ncbi:MAG TPA: MoxR family ATPase [Tepidisphaeraceae bacterium]|jgi:MoxR-like ATPase|nr:MoxR family ATPase [Tepidisphaeraceae bacterium]
MALFRSNPVTAPVIPPVAPSAPPVDSDLASARELAGACAALRTELGKTIVGQARVIEELLVAMLAGGHCLMQGVPGLAKTLLVSTLAQTADLSFQRIQFTPDLMPSDITGTDLLQEDPETHRRRFEFAQGPIFTNLLLADEINRTPPKTQAALLQAMQEREVTVAGRTFALPDPFFVLATQNPIEQEGTYPLPEAQLDRFMFMILVNYPGRDEELEVLRRTTGQAPAEIAKVIDAAKLAELRSLVRKVPVGEPVYRFALDLVRATRPTEAGASDFVRHWLSWGAGPRAGQYLILGGKARALLQGRVHVTLEDIEAVAFPVLRHRIVPNFNAAAEGITVDQIITKIFSLIPRGKSDKLL